MPRFLFDSDSDCTGGNKGEFGLAPGASRTFEFTVSAFTTARIPIAPVPLPAGGLLILSGLGGLAALKRRKKRAA